MYDFILTFSSTAIYSFFFFNDTATTEIYTLSLHERSSDLGDSRGSTTRCRRRSNRPTRAPARSSSPRSAFRCARPRSRSEEHTSELQSQSNLVCRLLLEKKKKLTSATGKIPSPNSSDLISN